MKKKLTNYFIPIAMLIVFLFAPRPLGIRHGYFPLFLLFGIFVWQKERLRNFFQNLKWPQTELSKFLAIAIIWSLCVEKVLGRQQEARYPFLIFLISLSFNIPYFLIWHKLITKFKNFTFSEVFIWSGLSGALAQTLFTPKVLGVFSDVSFIPACLMAIYNFLYILVMFGMLTSLPFTLLFEDKFGEGKALGAKEKILSMGSVFFALPFLIISIIILRVLFQTP